LRRGIEQAVTHDPELIMPRFHMLLATPIVLGCLLAVASPSARAEVFCVSTATELRQALLAASNNGEDDEIRIRSGTYPSPELQPFVYSTDANHDLTLSGGWSNFNNVPCVFQSTDPTQTLLDGEGERKVLSFNLQTNTGGDLVLRNFSIISAIGDAVSGGLRLYGPGGGFSGTVLLERMQFSGNVGGTGPALRIVGSNEVTVRNSVFMFNRSSNAWGIVNVSMGSADRGVYFINNTFMFNDHELASPGSSHASALSIDLGDNGQEQSRAYLANNLFWSNETPDLYTSLSGTVYLYNNNFAVRVGSVDVQDGNLQVDPMLEQAPIDFTPRPGSPMIDQGRSQPSPPLPFPTPFDLDWSYGNTDFYGSLAGRVVGERVDIGAVEQPVVDRLFDDRFEQ
jgi:hypothetical protein